VSQLCIVPCGKRKIWDKCPEAGPTAAKDVYIGTFAKKCREYAQKYHPTSWSITSAKYGFLFPNEIIPCTYNTTFNDKRTNPISIERLSRQVKDKKLDKYETIVVLGGKKYVEIIQKVFRGKEIINLLKGCRGIGCMLQRLKRSIESGIPLV